MLKNFISHNMTDRCQDTDLNFTVITSSMSRWRRFYAMLQEGPSTGPNCQRPREILAVCVSQLMVLMEICQKFTENTLKNRDCYDYTHIEGKNLEGTKQVEVDTAFYN